MPLIADAPETAPLEKLDTSPDRVTGSADTDDVYIVGWNPACASASSSSAVAAGIVKLTTTFAPAACSAAT